MKKFDPASMPVWPSSPGHHSLAAIVLEWERGFRFGFFRFLIIVIVFSVDPAGLFLPYGLLSTAMSSGFLREREKFLLRVRERNWDRVLPYNILLTHLLWFHRHVTQPLPQKRLVAIHYLSLQYSDMIETF